MGNLRSGYIPKNLSGVRHSCELHRCLSLSGVEGLLVQRYCNRSLETCRGESCSFLIDEPL